MRFKFIAIPVLLIILIALLLPTGIMPRSQLQAAGLDAAHRPAVAPVIDRIALGQGPLTPPAPPICGPIRKMVATWAQSRLFIGRAGAASCLRIVVMESGQYRRARRLYPIGFMTKGQSRHDANCS